MEVGILGAGGHARSVYDCLVLSSGESLTVRFYDDRYPEIKSLEGQPVVGSLCDAFDVGAPQQVFVAIGSNALRFRLSQRLTEAGRVLLTICHPRCIISPRATIGVGVIAIPGSVVNAGADVGNGVILNTLSSVGHDCVVLPYAQLASGVNLGGGANIGMGAFLGLGVKVCPNTTVGDWTVVGAGSVVLRDLPPRTFCYGTPARVIRKLSAEELQGLGSARESNGG